MKKFIAVIMAVCMLVLSVGAQDMLFKPMLNYSAVAEMKMGFTTADEIVDYLESLGVNLDATGIDTFNFNALFASLLSFDANMTVQSDISEDYSKIKLSMQVDYDYDVDVNSNLAVGLDMKFGMWLDMDISDLNNPKCDVIIVSPMSEKYMYCDLFDFVPSEQSRLMTIAIIKSLLNEEFVNLLCEELEKSYKANSEITTDGDVITIKLDNDGYVKLVDEFTAIAVERIITSLQIPEEMQQQLVIPEFSALGITMLGENGAVIEYNIKDNSIKTAVDVDISLADIVSSMGQDASVQDVAFDLSIGFDIVEEMTYSDVGTTVVEFPELSEQNSIDLYALYLENLVPEEDYYEDWEDFEEYEPEYPNFWVWVYTDYMPYVEGEVYVPLRAVLESAYDGNCNIAYDKGVITLTSEYFEDMEKVTLKVGESKAEVDGYSFEVGKVILHDGVTYVSSDFFEIVFLWTLEWAEYDFIGGEYYFEYATLPYEEW